MTERAPGTAGPANPADTAEADPDTDGPAGSRPYRRTGFDSGGTRCAAWHFPAADSGPRLAGGRPCVVMAHGLGGTKDSGLRPFAEGFADAGLDVLAFDYRGFGASEGTPRRTVSVRGQVADYRAALRTASALPGVDPAGLVLWGVSLSGGHVLTTAAGRTDVAAVVALTPFVDGFAAARHAAFGTRPDALLRSGARAGRAGLARALGRGPATMPVVGQPGEPAALSRPGYREAALALAGPTWRNEIDATVAVETATYHPARHAADVRAPLLVQIAEWDGAAPPEAAARAAYRAGAEVRRYPCDHFDVWPGRWWFSAALDHQIRFLRRCLFRG